MRIVGRVPPLDPLRFWASAAALVALALFDRWAWWRFGAAPASRIRLLLLLARALLVETAVAVEGFEQTALLDLVLPYRVLLGVGVPAGFLAGGAVWAFFSLKLIREDGIAGASQGMLIFALATLWTLVLSQIIMREQRARAQAEHLLDTLRRSHDELEQAHRRLEAYNLQAVALSVAQERNRLARDMHDSVGHALTGLGIQLEKALAFRSRDATTADDAVQAAKGLADHALEEVRQAVGLLRAEQPHFLLSTGLRELAEAAQRSGLRVALGLSGDEQHVPPETRIALFRVAQEGLTNVQRHAVAPLYNCAILTP